MNIEELKRLAEDATPGPWIKRGYVPGIGCGVDGVTAVAHHTTRADADFIAAANPAAVLELIDYVEYLRGKNREHFDACIGCDEELKRVSKKRDELLAALSIFMEVVDRPPKANCSCHLSPPCNDCVENFGLREAFSFADAAIAKAESKT